MKKSGLTTSLLGLASFVALLGCTNITQAARLVDITVVNRSNGERLTPYRHDGKLYIAGTPGERYAIELKSTRNERVLTVLSVDGINVLTGATAATLQSGYVLDGGQRYGISGWRKSMDEVAQFVFTALPDSYAARTGRPGNVGVIGVAVYREKTAVMPTPYAPAVEPWRGDSSARDRDEFAKDKLASQAPAPAAIAKKAESDDGNRERRSDIAESAGRALQEAKPPKLGTGHGEREYSPTRATEFVRNSDTPDEIITIYYDSRPNLVARGIIPSPRPAEPSPFPASAGFVPDPRG